jgi:hypothetical protein
MNDAKSKSVIGYRDDNKWRYRNFNKSQQKFKKLFLVYFAPVSVYDTSAVKCAIMTFK